MRTIFVDSLYTSIFWVTANTILNFRLNLLYFKMFHFAFLLHRKFASAFTVYRLSLIFIYTRQKKFCTLGSFGEFYHNQELMHLMVISLFREIILQQFDQIKTEILFSPTKHFAFEGSRRHPSKVAKWPIMAHKVEKNSLKDHWLRINCLVAVINCFVLFSTGMRITVFGFCVPVNMVCVIMSCWEIDIVKVSVLYINHAQ